MALWLERPPVAAGDIFEACSDRGWIENRIAVNVKASMNPVPLRILIVDDYEPLLRSLSLALSSRGYVVLGVATGEAALAAFPTFNADVLIVDWLLELGDPWNGERLLAHLRDSRAVKVLMTSCDDVGIRVRAADLGAIWISKTEPLPTLLALLEREGLHPLAETQEPANFGRSEDGPAPPSESPAGSWRGRYNLTSSECTVLAAATDGGTRDAIAAELGVSPETVKTHVHHLIAKTGDDSLRSAAVRLRHETEAARK